jgi:hypothetical protein
MTPLRKRVLRAVKSEFIRTLRYKGLNLVRTMPELMSVIAEQGGSIGDVKTLRVSEFYIWRDITIVANEMVARATAYGAIPSGVAQNTLDDVYFIDSHQ